MNCTNRSSFRQSISALKMLIHNFRMGMMAKVMVFRDASNTRKCIEHRDKLQWSQESPRTAKLLPKIRPFWSNENYFNCKSKKHAPFKLAKYEFEYKWNMMKEIYPLMGLAQQGSLNLKCNRTDPLATARFNVWIFAQNRIYIPSINIFAKNTQFNHYFLNGGTFVRRKQHSYTFFVVLISLLVYYHFEAAKVSSWECIIT